MDETCATDGLCSIACPVGIDTGKLIKELRWQNNGKLANRIADTISNNITEISSLLRVLLNIPPTSSQKQWVINQ